MATKIRPTIKLPHDERYVSDQSQIDRHRKTTANSPIRYAHADLCLRFLSSFESVSSTKALLVYGQLAFRLCSALQQST